MQTTNTTVCVILARESEDASLIAEIYKLQALAPREFMRLYPMLTELRQTLEADHRRWNGLTT